MDFSSRSRQKELIDRDDIPFADIQKNMQELDIINTWLGGHAISIQGLRQLIRDRKQVSICEIGCGGGDNLFALRRYCGRQNIAVQLTGIDHNPHCIAVARDRIRDSQTDWMISDYRDVNFADRRPDIIFSSLFCHHFTDEELVSMLQWMAKNAAVGWFINDLHRHPVAWFAIRQLTAGFSRSYLVKHDAPISVLRGFTRREWEHIFQKAGIAHYSIQWKWAFRWLLIARQEDHNIHSVPT
jgi:2-polyprenyl-3-methyl-5-hydroxy-6-metoxy-1,4-benzoquinol methylase